VDTTKANNRTCSNCAHRQGVVPDHWICGISGYYCFLELGGCVADVGFPHWAPRPTLIRRVIQLMTAH